MSGRTAAATSGNDQHDTTTPASSLERREDSSEPEPSLFMKGEASVSSICTGTSHTGSSSNKKKKKKPSDNAASYNPRSTFASPEITWHTLSGRRKTLKRKRPFLLELTVSLRDAPLYGGYGSHGGGGTRSMDRGDNNQQIEYDSPAFGSFLSMTGALLLTCTMAVVSALDAETQCVQHEEAYYAAIRQLVDDDVAAAAATDDLLDDALAGSNGRSSSSAHSEKCLELFKSVILPVAAATCVLAAIAICITLVYTRRNAQSSPSVGSPAFNTSGLVRITSVLFCFYLTILGLQSYHVTMLMLKPRHDYDFLSELDVSEQTDDDTAKAMGVNPYESLAASDRFGQVGANANLYYLTWINECLAITLVYQIATAFFRVRHAAQQRRAALLYNPSAYGAPKGSTTPQPLPAMSWDMGSHSHAYRNLLKSTSRTAWYTSLYRLRMRTGFWTAACISCLLIVASSQYIWRQVLWPYVAEVVNYYGDGVDDNDEASSDNSDGGYFSVCRDASDLGYFPRQLCQRTLAAWLSGVVAACLCATAILLHLAARYRGGLCGDSHYNSDTKTVQIPLDSTSAMPYYQQDDVVQLMSPVDDNASSTSWINSSPAALLRQYYVHHHPKRLSLRTELLLALLLSVLLGINAVLVTGVEGPAATVGNLYYASWLAFLLCLRICLGCVEEFYNIEEDGDSDDLVRMKGTADGSSKNFLGENLKSSYKAPDIKGDQEKMKSDATDAQDDSTSSEVYDDDKTKVPSTTPVDKQEKTRLNRVRGYFFLSIFSIVCAASAYDAALSQSFSLSYQQRYLMIAPCIVAVISSLLFGLCLSKRYYAVVARFWVGGILSIVSFGIFFGDLVLTMHSEDSWAVNGIGEIENANLYYFSWASILSAGLQMTSYLKATLKITKLDYMAAFWVTLCKVCFVILGAALHIWHTIYTNCDFDEITLGAVTFCSRTVLAITFSMTGMVVAGLVVTVRLMFALCPLCKCARVQAHVEMLVSLFLVLLFTAAVALITSIGGPGQSVGDLYYSTWLAFWVSLALFVECFKQLNDEETGIDEEQELVSCMRTLQPQGNLPNGTAVV